MRRSLQEFRPDHLSSSSTSIAPRLHLLSSSSLESVTFLSFCTKKRVAEITFRLPGKGQASAVQSWTANFSTPCPSPMSCTPMIRSLRGPSSRVIEQVSSMQVRGLNLIQGIPKRPRPGWTLRQLGSAGGVRPYQCCRC